MTTIGSVKQPDTYAEEMPRPLVEAITLWSELDVTAHEFGIVHPSAER